jgi:hypothetical protein
VIEYFEPYEKMADFMIRRKNASDGAVRSAIRFCSKNCRGGTVHHIFYE